MLGFRSQNHHSLAHVLRKRHQGVFLTANLFDFADWLLTQGRVSSGSEVFIDLLQRVRYDVTEALRLYTSQAVVGYFDSWPDKRTYIDKILHDMEKLLNDIGQFLETVQVSGDDGGTASLMRKFQWALSHQKKIRSKQQLLVTCHQSLMPAIRLMQTAEMNATFNPIHELPHRPWVENTVTASDIFKSPRSRQKTRFIQKNSPVPSIALSEPDLEDFKLEPKFPEIYTTDTLITTFGERYDAMFKIESESAKNAE
ncbi:hypothetical protein PMIN06_001139 [Paraphaeosphaeria minitans]|uniref:Uncharacterized protein n=1 Tax=Paraphaeosphaeria minitans TaxID=565426 RepID=A0A9P6KT17_9PLEO|nr:hypothetical protein PMIN01_05235 [Paraphaeosphaeria minitans]